MKVRNRQNAKRYMAARRAEARAEGICLICLKQPVREGSTRCGECSAREYARNRVKRAGAPEGMCRQCGRRPVVVDRKRCWKCLTYHREYQRRVKRPENNRDAVIRALSYGAMDQRELTAALGVEHRSTLRIVNDLIGRGLVERGVLDADGQDRRYVRLTAAGRKAVTELPPVYARRAA